MPDQGRDDGGRLKCRFPMCKGTIGGLTGLDELHKLIAHVGRKHGQRISLDRALDLRARWEEPDIPGADDQRARAGLRRKVEPEWS